MLRPLIQFELILLAAGIYFQSSTCGYPVFIATFVEEAIFFPLCVLGSFVENQLTAAA
jgi:hypothetical protein